MGATARGKGIGEREEGQAYRHRSKGIRARAYKQGYMGKGIETRV